MLLLVSSLLGLLWVVGLTWWIGWLAGLGVWLSAFVGEFLGLIVRGVDWLP